ncbi:hypothetical protein D9619_013608 [Psilocybe cf. subviscida]|uniref:NAD(P)-binding protein n=1 Tax=Psilocybe cf. subviscida TaxID=2480587 RepID=A0A8H5BR81_9AGAR|nr:hypothetical protein D9619_013608 [Psilocybe cf. subviscida]
MVSQTVYLITGASRGIGLGLVKELVTRHTNIAIVACVRDPDNAPTLEEVATAHPHAITVVRYIAGDAENNKDIVDKVKERFGGLDIVIANAGISNFLGTISETPADKMREHFEVNALAPLVLFQAVEKLLKASSNPKFIGMTSGAGSLSQFMDVPIGKFCYGSTKAVLNFMLRRIHFENDWITAFPLSPGLIITDMAQENAALDRTGFFDNIIKSYSMDMSVGAPMLVNIIESSTRATHGGEFMNIDGSKIAW